MDNYSETRRSIQKLEFDINEYVKQIIPMLLPTDASQEEEVKLKDWLHQIVSLEVYNNKIKAMDDKYHNEVQRGKNVGNFYNLRDRTPEMRALEIRMHLEKTCPEMPFRNRALGCLKHSRYVGEWSKKDGELSVKDVRRLEVEYAKRMWQKTSLKDYMSSLQDHPHIQAIMDIRNFFHNGGNMAEINLNSKEYVQLKESVQQLREILKEKILNMGRLYTYDGTPFNPNIFTDVKAIETQRIFGNAIENSRRVAAINNLNACKTTIKKELEQKKQKFLTQQELRRLSHPIIELFGKEFSELPTNEEQHEEQLEKIYAKLADIISDSMDVNKTTKEQHVKIMKDTYQKYMKQIKAHTLPIRLSYYAEDKKAYAQILKDARKEQERARENGEYQLPMGYGIISITSVLASCATAMNSLYIKGDFLTPTIQTIGLLSAQVIYKVCERYKLKVDVEKQLGIRQKRIIQVRGFKKPSQMSETLNKEKKDDINTTKEKQSTYTVYRNIPAYKRKETVPNYESIKVIYDEIPKHDIQLDNIESQTKPKIRRRVDKYKDEYNNSDSIEL